MAVDKRCAASGRALQAESAASEIQHVKMHLRKTLQNQSKCMHERRFAMMSLLQDLCFHEPYFMAVHVAREYGPQWD